MEDAEDKAITAIKIVFVDIVNIFREHYDKDHCKSEHEQELIDMFANSIMDAVETITTDPEEEDDWPN